MAIETLKSVWPGGCSGVNRDLRWRLQGLLRRGKDHPSLQSLQSLQSYSPIKPSGHLFNVEFVFIWEKAQFKHYLSNETALQEGSLSIEGDCQVLALHPQYSPDSTLNSLCFIPYHFRITPLSNKSPHIVLSSVGRHERSIGTHSMFNKSQKKTHSRRFQQIPRTPRTP